MLRIRTLTAAGLALPFVLGLGLASAGSAGHGPGGHGGHGRFLERKLDKLELAPETRTQVQAVIDAARPAREASKEQIHAAHREMRALLDQDTVDEAAVMAQADALGALMTQRRKNHLSALIRVRSLLSEEQRAALDARMKEHRAHRHGWRGRHGGFGHGDAPATPAPDDLQS